MQKFQPRSIVLSIATACLAAAAAGSAHAASVTIEQQTTGASYGSWMLQTPDSGTIHSLKEERLHHIPSAQSGSYTLSVQPPRDAHTRIVRTEAGIRRSSETANSITFTVGTGATHILIEYTYRGGMYIESVPSGARFEVSGPAGVRYTGTTPARFDDLAPFAYTVNFGHMEGCNPPRSMKRSLQPEQRLEIRGEYICGNDRLASASSASSAQSSSASTASSAPGITSGYTGALALWQSAHQSEVLPGGTLRLTAGVRNRSRTTIRDITMVQQFDATQMVPVEPIPNGGTVEGNLIIWRIERVNAGQSWSVVIPFAVQPDVHNGSQISIAARASAPDGQKTFVGDIAATTTVGVATLPATGGRMDALLIAVITVAAALWTAATRCAHKK